MFLRREGGEFYHSIYQCFGSGSVWIRIIWSDPDPDPDPYQETIDMDPGSVKNNPKPWNK